MMPFSSKAQHADISNNKKGVSGFKGHFVVYTEPICSYQESTVQNTQTKTALSKASNQRKMNNLLTVIDL
jgi:hypothetical protein